MKTDMKRIAIIDLGSNSIRFIIMSISKDGSYKLTYQEKRAIRLSRGMTDDGMNLTEEAQERALSCLKVYAHIAEVQKIDKMFAVATAAVRNAENGADFLQRVQEETGIPIVMISGREEARLGYLGVINTINLTDFIMFDLGGASVELSLVRGRKRICSVSIPIGAVTLTELFHSEDTVPPSLRKKISAYIQQKLKKEDWLKNSDLPIVGVGGTLRNLAKIHQRRIHYPIPKIHNYEFPISDFFAIVTDICNLTCAERKKIPGLSAERSDIICAGSLVIEELLRISGSKNLIVSGCGLREGIFFYYSGPAYMNGADYPRDMLFHSVMNYRHTLALDDAEHVTYVTDLALSMFDQWVELHGLSPRERQLLHAAGLLHDIGICVNYYSHARHSAYMIANAHLFGLSHKEQIQCALIAAFHHGYSMRFTRFVSYYQILTKEEILRVRKLSFLLNMAESMDETSERLVSRLVCKDSPDHADMHIYVCSGRYDVAAHALAPAAAQFTKLFKKPLMLRWIETSDTPPQK